MSLYITHVCISIFMLLYHKLLFCIRIIFMYQANDVFLMKTKHPHGLVSRALLTTETSVEMPGILFYSKKIYLSYLSISFHCIMKYN